MCFNTLASSCGASLPATFSFCHANSKTKFVRFHVHTTAAKMYAFGLQSESLLDSVISPELDFTARSKHPLPRQSE